MTPEARPTVGQRLRGWARRIKRDAVTLWFACRHARTPWAAKAVAAVVVAHALSPIDLVPDFIPVVGYLDDVILLPALIWLAVRLLPPDLLVQCREKADAWMASRGSKPTSRWGIVFVAAVWIGVAVLLWAWWSSR